MPSDAAASVRRSAGLLLFRRPPAAPSGRLEVLLGHMGGPFWARKDARAWSIPKGEHTPDEEALEAARREFAEEVGLPVPEGRVIPLGEVRQSRAKTVHAWAVEGDVDVAAAVSNTFSMEWPPRSGTYQDFPEMDRFAWFPVEIAADKVVAAQVSFLDRLTSAVPDLD